MTTEQDLIEDLALIGINVSSVWDLVNGPNNYNEALPVLMKHLELATDERFKEGIVRAMAVKGFSIATPLIIKEFYKTNNESYKWAIGNTLATIAPKNSLEELIKIMADGRHGDSRQMVAEALGRIGGKKSIPVLLKALEDDDISGHAIEALGRLADDETVIEKIKPFLKHKMKWKRKAAKVAIDRIKKRHKKIKEINSKT